MSIRPFEGHTPDLHGTAYVDDTALVIGNVSLAEDCSVWPMCVLRGDIQSIQVGARSNIQDGSIIHVTHDSEYTPGGYATTVGEDVTVGHRVTLHGCEVADRCLIGMGTIILDGVRVQPETMLGAGCVVPPGRELESGFLWVGSPARKLRELTDAEREFLRYSAAHYVKTKNRHQKL